MVGKLTQYKSTVYWDKDKTLGAPFVMYYNAGGHHPETNLKGERVGIALSKDMKTWKRYSEIRSLRMKLMEPLQEMRISKRWEMCM